MSASATASRRSFLKGGAIAAAPLAVIVPAAAMAENEHKARAQRLQDEAELRALHAAWLRKVATGEDASALFADAKASPLDRSIQAVSADHAGHPDRIDVAADGLTASGRFAVLADLQTELPKTTTLTQMAHLQGNGVVRHAERRTLRARYVKQGGAWAIAGVDLRAT